MVFYASFKETKGFIREEGSGHVCCYSNRREAVQGFPGDVVKVEKLAAKAGETVEIKDVYLVSDGDTMSVGKPMLASAKVTAEVLDESKGEKVLIFKHKRRKGFRKTIGHRQHFTTLKVKEIKA